MSEGLLKLSLVAHYGPKPPEFAGLVESLQAELAAALGGAFAPYAVEQVHSTLIGLELRARGADLLGENFLALRGEERRVDLDSVLDFVRGTALLPLEVQVGGFRNGAAYPFSSQGEHPFRRSFVISRGRAVAMGWPRDRGGYPSVLDTLRRELQRLGVLHKWHRRPEDEDNDFYFVLGTVDQRAAGARAELAASAIRDRLATQPPLAIAVRADDIACVIYDDERLPPASTRRLAVADPTVRGATLRGAANDPTD